MVSDIGKPNRNKSKPVEYAYQEDESANAVIVECASKNSALGADAKVLNDTSEYINDVNSTSNGSWVGSNNVFGNTFGYIELLIIIFIMQPGCGTYKNAIWLLSFTLDPQPKTDILLLEKLNILYFVVEKKIFLYLPWRVLHFPTIFVELPIFAS